MNIDNFLRWKCLDSFFVDTVKDCVLKDLIRAEHLQNVRVMASALKALATFSAVMLAGSALFLITPPVAGAVVLKASVGLGLALGARTARLEYKEGPFSSPMVAAVHLVASALRPILSLN